MFIRDGRVFDVCLFVTGVYSMCVYSWRACIRYVFIRNGRVFDVFIRDGRLFDICIYS